MKCCEHHTEAGVWRVSTNVSSHGSAVAHAPSDWTSLEWGALLATALGAKQEHDWNDKLKHTESCSVTEAFWDSSDIRHSGYDENMWSMCTQRYATYLRVSHCYTPKNWVRGRWDLEQELPQNVWVVKLQYVNTDTVHQCAYLGKEWLLGSALTVGNRISREGLAPLESYECGEVLMRAVCRWEEECCDLTISPLLQRRVTTPRPTAGGICTTQSDPLWKKADLSQIQLLFMSIGESHKNM